MYTRLTKLTTGLFALGVMLFGVTWIALPPAEGLLKSVRSRTVITDRRGEPLGNPLGTHPQLGKPHTGVYVPLDSLPSCTVPFVRELEGFSYLGPKLVSLPKCLWELRGCSSVDMQSVRVLFDARSSEADLFEAGNEVGGWTMRLYRKGLEMVMASKLAWTTPPAKRFELYLNVSRFLPQRRGISFASARLFGKHPSRLRCDEIVQLITLLSEPTRYKRGRRQDFLEAHRLRLKQLYSAGLISKTKRKAWMRPPPFEWHEWSYAADAPAMDRAVGEARHILAGTSYSFSDGLRIKTSVDRRVQARADSVLRQAVGRWATGEEVPRTTLTLMQPEGSYRAYVVSSATEPGYMDLIQKEMQPGSRGKAVVFALAIAVLRERGLSPNQIFQRSLPTRYVLRDKEGEKIKEFGSHCLKYGPRVTLRKALVESCNGAAMHLANELLRPRDISSFLSAFGIDVKPHKAIALGAYGVSEDQITALYNGLLNTYRPIRPHVVEQIATRSGRLIYEDTTSIQPPLLLAPEVGAMMRELLRQVVEEGTAVRLHEAYPDAEFLSVKTGTSLGGRQRYRGITGLLGGPRDMVVSLTVQGQVPMPSAPRSAVPVAGKVLRAVQPILNRTPL